MTINEYLEKLSAIEKKACSAPWVYCHGNSFDHWELWNPNESTWVVQDDSGVEPFTDDLELIKESRNALPVLIEMVKILSETQRKVLYWAQGGCSECDGWSNECEHIADTLKKTLARCEKLLEEK